MKNYSDRRDGQGSMSERKKQEQELEERERIEQQRRKRLKEEAKEIDAYVISKKIDEMFEEFDIYLKTCSDRVEKDNNEDSIDQDDWGRDF